MKLDKGFVIFCLYLKYLIDLKDLDIKLDK